MAEKRNSLITWFIYLLLSLGLIAMDGIGWTKGIRALGERVLVPILLEEKNGVEALNSPIRWYRFYRNGTARILDLEARLSENLVNKVEMARLSEENDQLLAEIGAKSPAKWKIIPAKVLGIAPGKMIIVGGEADGFKKGMSVEVGGNFVGVLEHVSGLVSEVRLLDQDQNRITGRVLDKKTIGIVKNDGGQVLLTNVLQGADLSLNDVIITEGTDGIAPGLVVGSVVEIIGKSSDVYKSARLLQPIAWEQVKVVMVVVE
jgi:cell shape-determining protein MreC